MAEINIDKNQFHERLSHFIGAWKADKRSGDALFNGASSILILLGKAEETSNFQKNNSIHVSMRNGFATSGGQIYGLETFADDERQFWLLGYEFPSTLFLFTVDGFTVVTTSKKGTYSMREDHTGMRSLEKLTMSSKASGTTEGWQDSHRDSSSRKGRGGKCESLRQDC